MSEVPAEDRHAALAVLSRRRMLDALRVAEGPLDVGSLAEVVGLHPTTTRSHLEVLERAGLVRRAAEREGRPGRPRLLYRSVEDSDSDHQLSAERFRTLAGLLAGALVADPADLRRRAEDAGRRWAETLVPAEPATWDQATRRVETVFEALGFAPRLVDDDAGRHLALRGCPFRDLAREHPAVVCVVHAGLLRGLLSRLGMPTADDAEIRPFVDVDLCVADLPDSPE